MSEARLSLPARSVEIPLLNDGDGDDIGCKMDAARQRVQALLDESTSAFADAGASGCGWEGVIDHAKSRLLQAQVPVRDELIDCLFMTL